MFPFQIRRWHNQGLPLGQHSAENAILMKSTKQWPLLIDPHKQALTWIRQMEGPKLQEISAQDSNCTKKLVFAMQTGESVLLQVCGPRSLTPPFYSRLYYYTQWAQRPVVINKWIQNCIYMDVLYSWNICAHMCIYAHGLVLLIYLSLLASAMCLFN